MQIHSLNANGPRKLMFGLALGITKAPNILLSIVCPAIIFAQAKPTIVKKNKYTSISHISNVKSYFKSIVEFFLEHLQTILDQRLLLQLKKA